MKPATDGGEINLRHSETLKREFKKSIITWRKPSVSMRNLHKNLV